MCRHNAELRHVIRHPVGLKYFTMALKKEFSEENIDVSAAVPRPAHSCFAELACAHVFTCVCARVRFSFGGVQRSSGNASSTWTRRQSARRCPCSWCGPLLCAILTTTLAALRSPTRADSANPPYHFSHARTSCLALLECPASFKHTLAHLLSFCLSRTAHPSIRWCINPAMHPCMHVSANASPSACPAHSLRCSGELLSCVCVSMCRRLERSTCCTSTTPRRSRSTCAATSVPPWKRFVLCASAHSSSLFRAKNLAAVPAHVPALVLSFTSCARYDRRRSTPATS